jgi:hypothetical protein
MGMAALPVAMMAASTAVSVAGQAKQASAQKQQVGLQNAQNALQLASQERSSQDALQKTLARQSAWYGAKGVDAASGSALGLANAAKTQADRQLSLLYAADDLEEQRRRLASGSDNTRLGMFQSLLNLGMSAGSQLMSSGWK